jgi:hypothetical protein
MDVVHANVGREPPEDGRKSVVRAAMERCLVQACWQSLLQKYVDDFGEQGFRDFYAISGRGGS